MTFLKVQPKTGYDLTDFVEELHTTDIFQKFDIKILQDEKVYDIENLKEILIEKGQTEILKEEKLFEHLVVPGTPHNLIATIIQKYVNKISVDSELIIVDPFFYPSHYPANCKSSAESGQKLVKS
jgi:hypothetical protein